jgi:hypothetical protein
VTDDELREAVVWLYASDSGLARSAGHEPTLRALCRQAVWDRLVTDEVGLRVWVSKLVRDVFLSDDALRGGFGVEDACEFWSWFDQNMWTRSGSGGECGESTDLRSPDPACLVWPALQSVR